MTNPRSQDVAHVVTGAGPAKGMTFSGRKRLVDGEAGVDKPLIVALHGGAYTSTYFDVPDYSLLDRAAACGVPVLAIDRPGYRDSTPVDPGESIILANAEVLDHLIAELWEAHGADTAGVVLVGQSIGGAVATALSARRPSWPLLGMAVSGCLLQAPTEARGRWDAPPDVTMVDVPSSVRDLLVFGPEWTYAANMPAASHIADAPARKDELMDITGSWIGRVRSVAAQINVPVHVRQAEFDKLWITDEEQVAEFGDAFVEAASVDARLVRSAGHCIDFHRVSAAFQLDQLAFALACCIKPE